MSGNEEGTRHTWKLWGAVSTAGGALPAEGPLGTPGGPPGVRGRRRLDGLALLAGTVGGVDSGAAPWLCRFLVVPPKPFIPGTGCEVSRGFLNTGDGRLWYRLSSYTAGPPQTGFLSMPGSAVLQFGSVLKLSGGDPMATRN